MANNHPDKVPVANNQGGLMFSNTPEVIVTKTKLRLRTGAGYHGRPPPNRLASHGRSVRAFLLYRGTPLKYRYSTDVGDAQVDRVAGPDSCGGELGLGDDYLGCV